MPQPEDHNSKWTRREEITRETESNMVDSEEQSLVDESQEADWYSQEIDDDAEEYDLSLKFEDFAPVWLQKLKGLYDKNPEWSVASAIGVVALVLTTLLFLSMPAPTEEPVVEAPEPEIIPFVLEPTVTYQNFDEEPIDSRVEIEPEASFPVEIMETEPLLVSFGDLPDAVVEHRAPRESMPEFKLPDLKFPTEPAAAPELAMNVQRIRVIEREMLDPTIDEPFVVTANPTSQVIPQQLEPGERLLFDDSWQRINLVRADQQAEPVIRPTLYHERFPGGEHVQVGREQPQERDHLDHLIRVTAPGHQEQLEIEIRKQAPREGTSQKLLTYSILVKNGGSSPAFDVQVEETISPTASLVDLSPPAAVSQNRVTWKLPQLAAGEERELLIKVFPNREGQVQTSSAIRLASNVTAATEITAPQLVLQVNGPKAVTTGEVFAMDFVVTNRGPQSQSDVILNLDLPEALTHEQGRRLTFKIDQLAANESRQLRARVKAVKTGPVTSQAALVLQGRSLEEAALNQQVSAPVPRPAAPQSKVTKPAPASPQQTAAPAPSCPCQPPVYYLPAPYLIP
ncbi:Large cysteine-rich periplasmic protein OmcB precursor [Gimesia panareensis]|uniref:Large cysteine-rich periplasmic protein OmcB n=1 Tax=Gimesia panareensis TaxID=2527978 RepID=A0A517QBL1_9PLAN|nr:DUF11 domain-containing protein [Gimesia panareensis]QDT28985.1 Large cysteine-rich periplasmic protein OmcB precursor [Gimesia panareensis]